MASASDFGYGFFIVIGFLGVVVPPWAQFGKLLEKNDYLLMVGLPTILGLLSLGFGITMLAREHYNEVVLTYLIILFSMGAIATSIGGTLYSSTRLLYASA